MFDIRGESVANACTHARAFSADVYMLRTHKHMAGTYHRGSCRVGIDNTLLLTHRNRWSNSQISK